MEIILNKDRAMKAVNIAGKFAASASDLKVLQGVFLSAGFGHVRLTTTDLTLWCQVELDAETPQPGTVLVPVAALGKALKSIPHSRVTLCKEGDGVRLAGGTSEIRVKGLNAEEYPESNPPQDRLLSMPLPAALVNQVVYAVSKDETRYTLGGVYMQVGPEGLKLVATDGHRLARYTAASLPPGSVVDVEVEEPLSVIVPSRLLNEGVRLGSQLDTTATLELYEKAACIRVNGSVMVWADVIEGQYPGYEGVVPDDFTGRVTVSRSALGKAVSRLLTLSKGRRWPAACLIVDGWDLVLKMEEDAGDGISATERLKPSEIEGIVPVCGLNIRYLSEALERIPESAQVHLRFSDEPGERPVAIESSASAGLLAVLMPVKV